ncbi:hypothetical protein M8R19_09695 [Pseudomonas sp. R3.Fl]|uniref:hypothetical protein n=1 Tax=Pseudomonas TaxID=286 RepID=UPI00201E65F4|nr:MULTISPECIES: hypothetical protein [Pseudomonas]MCL6688986.1 hypothetical protein [Pseudomonas sp. R3.Fl]MCP1642503.1 hypothetical protein [Pseudomonas citronellolis]MCP1665386.1 hypothetical protein [Pseudomonas citronellolis]MCP1696336.1 hypothetical protein [Pseudomonas citronellolis]MCP1702923.1 hypothetical protein [Pseudomonas citronellolis]
MKKLIYPVVLLVVARLFLGYYESIDDAELNTNFFIKRHPTFQMEFVNLFANDADSKPLQELSAEERQLVIDYCRYRLGIETRLQSQTELDACKKR